MKEQAGGYDNPDLILLFDANMPHLDDCCDSCINNGQHLCVHRFVFKAKVLYLEGRESHFPDLKVVLKFWQWLIKNPFDILGVIITRDGDFVRDVQKEYNSLLAKKFRLPIFQFGNQSMMVNKEAIVIQNIINRNQKRANILRKTINILNVRWTQNP